MENKRQTGSFLSPEEKKILTEIASKDSTLAGKRAHALLLIDKGETHTGTAGKTGLTLGQLRYALVRFKKLGIAMFSQLSMEPGVTEPAADPEKSPKNKKEKKKAAKEKSLIKSTKKKNKKKKIDKPTKKKDKKEKKKKKEKKSLKEKKKK